MSQTTFACSGADGRASLVSIAPELPGSNCPEGGQQIRTGPDTNQNGALDPPEVTSTTFVCDGADGQEEMDGIDGANGSLVRVSVEPPGSACLNGGSRIESGPDANRDGVLDPSEVVNTSFACSGAARESRVTSTPIGPGPQCTNGGFRVDAGLDSNGNGTLDPAEVTSSAFVCNGLASVPFAILTDTLPEATANRPYGATLTAAGGTGESYEWSVSSGTLPPGLSLGPVGTPDTQITGVPTSGGTFRVTIEVRDFFRQVATRTFDLVVAAPPLAITTFVALSFRPGLPYTFTLGATGGAAPYTWSLLDGTLPAGLSLTPTGVLSETPTANLVTDATIRVTDTAGATREGRFTFRNQKRWVGFSADATTDTVAEVYVVDLSGPTPAAATTVSPTPVSGGSLGQTTSPTLNDVKMSRSGDKIAFIGDFRVDGIEEMWLVDLAGGAPSLPLQVAGPFGSSSANLDTDDWDFSLDGRWMAFIVDDVTDGEFNLYLVDTSSTAPVALRLNRPLPSGSDVDTADGFQLSPDSQKIAYISDEETAAVETLYVVDLATRPDPGGGPAGQPRRTDEHGRRRRPRLLHPGLPKPRVPLRHPGERRPRGVRGRRHRVEPYRADHPQRALRDERRRQPGLGQLRDRRGRHDPRGRGVFFQADGLLDGEESLFFVAFATPGTMLNLTPEIGLNEDVNHFVVSPDGSLVVVHGDLDTAAVEELWAIDISGATFSSPTRVNGALVTGGDVSSSLSSSSRDYDIFGDGLGVIYIADQNQDVVEEPFFTPLFAGIPGTSTSLITPVLNGDTYNVYR